MCFWDYFVNVFLGLILIISYSFRYEDCTGKGRKTKLLLDSAKDDPEKYIETMIRRNLEPKKHELAKDFDEIVKKIEVK